MPGEQRPQLFEKQEENEGVDDIEAIRDTAQVGQGAWNPARGDSEGAQKCQDRTAEDQKPAYGCADGRGLRVPALNVELNHGSKPADGHEGKSGNTHKRRQPQRATA